MSACMTLVCLALLCVLLGFDRLALHDHSNKQAVLTHLVQNVIVLGWLRAV